MRSFPATGWVVRYMHTSDLEHSSRARPARVLLKRDRTDGFVLPVRAENHQIHGAVLHDADESEWHALSPALVWRPGFVPVVLSTGRVEFITADAMENHRRREVERLVDAVLRSNRSADERRGFAEIADGILGVLRSTPNDALSLFRLRAR